MGGWGAEERRELGELGELRELRELGKTRIANNK